MMELPQMKATTVHGAHAWRTQRGALLWPRALLPLALSSTALVVDLLTPQGMIDGFLYVLPVLACIWIPSAGAAIYTALGLMPLLAIGFMASPPGSSMSAALTNELAGAITIWLTALVVRHNARSSLERESLLSQIRNLQRRTMHVAAAERTALSRWLHENIGQDLAAIGWGLDHIARRADHADEVRIDVGELRAAIDGAQRAVREKAKDLRQLHAQGDGLQALIERHAAAFSTRTSTPLTMTGLDRLPIVPAEEADLCFRVVQEALTNVVKHAGATQVSLEFQATPHVVRVIVTDDGRGLSAMDLMKPDSLGLLGLRERVLAIGGELTVVNTMPRGVRVEAKIPWRSD